MNAPTPRTAAESIAAVSPFEATANAEAARIAAHEVEGRALHCPVHRASLEAWKRGERSWPWPAPSDADLAEADAAVCKLFDALGIEPARVLTGGGQ